MYNTVKSALKICVQELEKAIFEHLNLMTFSDINWQDFGHLCMILEISGLDP